MGVVGAVRARGLGARLLLQRLERGGRVGARGTLRGDTLLLRYNRVMNMTDFEDGVYVRVPPTP